MAKTKVGTLQEILSTRAKMTWDHRVDIDRRYVSDLDLAVMKDWCKKNCKSLWRSETIWACYFQFESGPEAMMFALKWSNGRAAVATEIL